MMKHLLIIIMCFATWFGYGQIPSINEKVVSLALPINAKPPRFIVVDTTNNEVREMLKANDLKGKKAFNAEQIVHKIDKFNKLLAEKIIKEESLDADPIFLNYYRNRKSALDNTIKTLKENAEKEEDLSKIKEIRDQIAVAENELKKYTKVIKKIEGFELLFPSFEQGEADRFFTRIYDKDKGEELSLLNNAAIQFNGEGTALQSELVSAYLAGMRVSLGTLVANGEGEEEEGEQNTEVTKSEAFNRLTSGGGNIFMKIDLPVLFASSEHLTLFINAFTRAAADIDEFSDDVDTATGSGTLGSSLYASASTQNKEFIFFMNSSYGWYFGGDSFYNRLMIADRKAFGFGQLTFGVTVLNRLRLSLTTNRFGSERNLRTGEVLFGVQVLSGLFKK